MAAFINNSITAAGLTTLLKGVVGEKINFTRIVIGDGYLPDDQTPHTTTDIISPKAVIDITKLTLNGDGTVIVGGIFSNEQLDEGFYYRELGLYAEDPAPNVGEVLYCYGNAGDLAEWIAPTGGASVIEKVIDIVTIIGSATNVTAYIKSEVYASKEDFENYLEIVNAAQQTANNAINIANQAIAIANEAKQAVIDLTAIVAQNTSKIATLWDAVFSDITTNPFQITFSNLDGVTVTAGVYNSALQRLEC